MVNLWENACKGDSKLKKKFEKLSKYFDDLEEEELQSQNLFKYVDFAEPHLKGLMDIFIRDYLGPYLSTVEEEKTEPIPNRRAEIYYYGTSLFGKERVQSSTKAYLGGFTIYSLLGLECPLQEVTFIDLSNNQLMSSDLKFILELLQKLNANGQLKDTTLLLSGNRIHGVDDMENLVKTLLNEIVNMYQVKFLDLRDNPFCSYDQLSYFRHIGVSEDINYPRSTILPSKEILNKLIWIERWNLFSKNWGTMFQMSEEIVKKIRISHMNYYEPENMHITCSNEIYCVSKNNILNANLSALTCDSCGNSLVNSKSLNHTITHKNRRYMLVNDLLESIRDWENGSVRGFDGK